MILFYGVDAGGVVEPSCGGEEVLASDPAGNYFNSC